MAGDDSLPPEIQAAKRALGGAKPSVQPTSPGFITHASVDSNELDSVLRLILAAMRVDFIGVFPASCIPRLTELANEQHRVEPQSRPPLVHYYTPARDRITLYRHSGMLGTMVQRWMSGITGLRNWADPRRPEDSATERLAIFEFDDIYIDCIIRLYDNKGESIYLISQIPAVMGGSSREDQDSPPLFVVSQVSADKRPGISAHLDILQARSLPLIPRQIRCIHDVQPSADGSFIPTIARLAQYGRLVHEDVEPVAVVAVCVNTAIGPCVLLKHRSRENARDDFDTLSMISERILVEDVDQLLPGPRMEGAPESLDSLWIRAGQPESFEIPEPSFRLALQRELFVTCGLDIRDDRFLLKGNYVLEREGEGTYLGFFIYRLDLIRSDILDELKQAVAWNPRLTLLPIRDLYNASNRPRLNRLLRQREGWLRKVIFSQNIT